MREILLAVGVDGPQFVPVWRSPDEAAPTMLTAAGREGGMGWVLVGLIEEDTEADG